MRLLFFLSLMAISFSACKSVDKDTPKGKLYGEVMDIHDEAMPLMSDINKQMKAIKKKRKDTLVDELDRFALRHLKSLELAEDAMMDWMANFDRSIVKNDTEEVMAYLEDQKIKITQINADMNSAVRESKSFIHSLSQSN